MNRRAFTAHGLKCSSEIVRYARGPWRVHGRITLPEGLELTDEQIAGLGWDCMRGRELVIAFNGWILQDAAEKHIRETAAKVLELVADRDLRAVLGLDSPDAICEARLDFERDRLERMDE